jgi:CDP-diacylglycerol--glycerol-3-phosphate 3-phosphatidyltransferase
VTVPILVREIGITVYRFAVLRKRVIPASKGGKLKTVLQSVAITFALAPLAQLLGAWVDVVDTVLMAAAFVITIVTGVQYLIDDRRLNGR